MSGDAVREAAEALLAVLSDWKAILPGQTRRPIDALRSALALSPGGGAVAPKADGSPSRDAMIVEAVRLRSGDTEAEALRALLAMFPPEAPSSPPVSDAWDALRDDVLHNADGYDNDTVNHYLGLIDYHRPADAPPSAAVDEPKSAADVLAWLREASDPTTGEPTQEQAEAIWALMRHPATTRLMLAVQAWERGQSYAALKTSSPPVEAVACKAADLLAVLYDKWENGTECAEGPWDDDGPQGNPIGHAFDLDADEEREILAEIERHKPGSTCLAHRKPSPAPSVSLQPLRDLVAITRDRMARPDAAGMTPTLAQVLAECDALLDTKPSPAPAPSGVEVAAVTVDEIREVFQSTVCLMAGTVLTRTDSLPFADGAMFHILQRVLGRTRLDLLIKESAAAGKEVADGK